MPHWHGTNCAGTPVDGTAILKIIGLCVCVLIHSFQKLLKHIVEAAFHALLSMDCSTALILCSSTVKLQSLYLPHLKKRGRKPFSILHSLSPIYSTVVLLLRQSAMSHSQQKPGFDPKPVPMEFMVDNVAWDWLSSVSMSLPLLHAHSFIYHRCYIMLAADSVV